LDAQQAAKRVRLLTPRFPLDLSTCQQDRLEAALAAPRAGYGGFERYPSVASKAAALLYSVAKGHVCPTANKRLAFLLAATFLVKNDRWLWAKPDEVIEELERVAGSDVHDGDAVKAELTTWVDERLIDPAEALVRLHAGLGPGELP
jgi:prophage maintenance system killer protein